MSQQIFTCTTTPSQETNLHFTAVIESLNLMWDHIFCSSMLTADLMFLN